MIMLASVNTFILIVLPLISTASSGSSFNQIDQGVHHKLKTIAVVAGLNTEINQLAAELMTETLTKNNLFQVVPSHKVTLMVQDFPGNIRGPYTSAYFGIQEDYSNTDATKIKGIQKKLGVDYLYVLWAPSSTGSFGSRTLHLIGQLFEGPESEKIYGDSFDSTARSGFSCLFFSKTPSGEKQLQALKETCEEIAGDIAEKTGTFTGKVRN